MTPVEVSAGISPPVPPASMVDDPPVLCSCQPLSSTLPPLPPLLSSPSTPTPRTTTSEEPQTIQAAATGEREMVPQISKIEKIQL